MMELNVFFQQEQVGVLTQNEEVMYSFQYTTTWLKSPSSFALSLQLPKQEEAFGHRLTLSFFENLLPEGEVREVLVHHRSQGVFQTLQRYGEDCAGAIVITPKMTAPQPKKEHQEVLLSQDEIAEALKSGTMVDVLATRNPGYLSLAGAQDKFPAIVRDDKIYLPLSGTPTTHIIKPPIIRFKESVYNEYFCMRLAKNVGLNTPNVHIIQGKLPLFVIERFDRKQQNGVTTRLHQQDFCQAQGYSSEKKYEIQGGPSFVDCYTLIKHHVHFTKRAANIFSLLDWLCFNLLIGNNDCHSKNLSLLLLDGRYELTPFYDLLCTVIYPSLQSDFAFQIGGRYSGLDLSTKHIKELEHQLSIRSGTILEHLQKIWDSIKNESSPLVQAIEERYPDCKIARRITKIIPKRAKAFRKIGLQY